MMGKKRIEFISNYLGGYYGFPLMVVFISIFFNFGLFIILGVLWGYILIRDLNSLNSSGYKKEDKK